MTTKQDIGTLIGDDRARYEDLKAALDQGYSELKGMEHQLMRALHAEHGGKLETKLVQSERHVLTLDGKRLWEILKK